MTPDEFMALLKREECSGAMYRACLTFAAQAEADRAEVAAMRPVVAAAEDIVCIGYAGEEEWHDLIAAVTTYRAGTPAPKPPRFTAAEAAGLLAVAAAVDMHGLERWDAMVAECKEVSRG